MTIGFAVEELAAAVILAQCPSKEIPETIEAEVGDLVFTILNVELHVVEDAAESDSMTSMNPVVDRRSFVLVLKDSSVCEIRRGPDAHLVARERRDGSATHEGSAHIS